jgi:hypothetical protein
MSDYIEEVIEGNIEAIEEPIEAIDKIEVNASANDEPRYADDKRYEDKDKKKKKPYVLSPLRLEALAKAREKAFSLRKEFHKEPTVKKEKIKKKSKLEVILENRELKKKVNDEKVDDDSANEDKDNKVVDAEDKDNKVVYADDAHSALGNDKDKRYDKVVVKTRPSFVRNDNGFFCI